MLRVIVDKTEQEQQAKFLTEDLPPWLDQSNVHKSFGDVKNNSAWSKKNKKIKLSIPLDGKTTGQTIARTIPQYLGLISNITNCFIFYATIAY